MFVVKIVLYSNTHHERELLRQNFLDDVQEETKEKKKS